MAGFAKNFFYITRTKANHYFEQELRIYSVAVLFIRKSHLIGVFLDEGGEISIF